MLINPQFKCASLFNPQHFFRPLFQGALSALRGVTLANGGEHQLICLRFSGLGCTDIFVFRAYYDCGYPFAGVYDVVAEVCCLGV